MGPEEEERQRRAGRGLLAGSQAGMCKGPGADGTGGLAGHVRAGSTLSTQGSLGTTALCSLQEREMGRGFTFTEHSLRPERFHASP